MPGTDRKAMVWRLDADGKGGELVASLPGHTGWVRDIAQGEVGFPGGGRGNNLYSIGCNFIKVWETPIARGEGTREKGGAGDAGGEGGEGLRLVGDLGGGGEREGEGPECSEGLRLVGDLCVEGDQLRVACGGGHLFSAGIDGSLRAWRFRDPGY